MDTSRMTVMDVLETIQDMIAVEKRNMMTAEINPLINDIFAVERAAIKIEALEQLLERIRLRKEAAK